MLNTNKVKCPQIYVYIFSSIITILNLLISHKYDEVMTNGSNKVLYTIIYLVGMALWIGVLYYLCSIGYSKSAWFVVLFPYILFVVALLFLLSVFITKKYRSSSK